MDYKEQVAQEDEQYLKEDLAISDAKASSEMSDVSQWKQEASVKEGRWGEKAEVCQLTQELD